MRISLDKRVALLEDRIGDSSSEDDLRVQREWQNARFPYFREKFDELIRRGADDETYKAEMAALRHELDIMFPPPARLVPDPQLQGPGLNGVRRLFARIVEEGKKPKKPKYGSWMKSRRCLSGESSHMSSGSLWAAMSQRRSN